jgi:hypothetical protein
METNGGKPIGENWKNRETRETRTGKIERGRQRWTEAEFDQMERETKSI